MRLEVVTPRGKLLSVDATEVTAPGIRGEFGVLPGHVPFLSGMKPGVLQYATAQSGSGRLAVGAGFAEVGNDRVIVLADQGAAPAALAEKLAEQGQNVPVIDPDVARRELAEAQRELEQFTSDDEGARRLIEGRIDWAQARLDALG